MSPAARRRRLLIALVAAIAAVVALAMLERARHGITITDLAVGDTPATLYRATDTAGDAPLAVIAHGFGGSRQMMEAMSLTLARAGMAVVAFDFHGQGRSRLPMSPDAFPNEAGSSGTTVQLVRQTLQVIDAAEALPGLRGPAALIGHSMATDILVRVAAQRPGIKSVALISAFSREITPQAPARLLILSGQREGRLREVALEALAQVTPSPQEGQTVKADGIERRAAVAPWVGHAGVLWSPTTLRELRDWLAPGASAVAVTGPWIVVLLTALVALVGPASALLPTARRPAPSVGWRFFLILLAAPALPAALAAVALGESVLGFAGFGRIALFFGVWGAVQLALLAHYRRLDWRIDPAALALLLAGSLLYALAMDRYAAAFLPTGPRLGLMAVLAAGTVPFMLAHAHLAKGARFWRRGLLAVVPLIALGGAMAAAPQKLGLSFTVAPVFLLFLLVFGLMGRWVGRRSGPATVGLGLGIVLAWAIAATTPLFGAASRLVY
ncbi:serine aminopeptidase S33 family [Cereibacter ovatus]|uniref:Serine aminopeptidase S33 family n=1 Tax=Cereibacter ovatus TaxID=439529 RepID=A0A285D2E2_9RHOB|nr:alpha/beta fold hydrolase [Cereibacter ovatus]SNX73835.1 serine aminopeptidase S33 family [Cereibacter ovatus]